MRGGSVLNTQLEFLVYHTVEGNVSVNAFIHDETIWITANQMATLFDKSESTIRKHINNVFNERQREQHVKNAR